MSDPKVTAERKEEEIFSYRGKHWRIKMREEIIVGFGYDLLTKENIKIGGIVKDSRDGGSVYAGQTWKIIEILKNGKFKAKKFIK